MIFEERFQTLLDRLEPSLALLLVGFDGISVVSKVKPGCAIDPELFGAEISAIIKQLRQAAFLDAIGEMRELTLTFGQATILLKIMTKDYFMALVMRPDGHLAKGRFLLRLMERELRDELA